MLCPNPASQLAVICGPHHEPARGLRQCLKGFGALSAPRSCNCTVFSAQTLTRLFFRENHAVCSKSDGFPQYGKKTDSKKGMLLEIAPVCVKLHPLAGISLLHTFYARGPPKNGTPSEKTPCVSTMASFFQEGIRLEVTKKKNGKR